MRGDSAQGGDTREQRHGARGLLGNGMQGGDDVRGRDARPGMGTEAGDVTRTRTASEVAVSALWPRRRRAAVASQHAGEEARKDENAHDGE